MEDKYAAYIIIIAILILGATMIVDALTEKPDCTYVSSPGRITPEYTIKVLSEGNDTTFIYRIK